VVLPPCVWVGVAQIVSFVKSLKKPRIVYGALRCRIVWPDFYLPLETSVYQEADGFVSHRRVSDGAATIQRAQRIVITDDALERPALCVH